MSKEDFLNMLSSELDNLEKETEMANQRKSYWAQIDPSSDEYKNAEYQLNLIYKKLTTVKSFIRYPAYSRIQKMSDIEIQEYKKEKIEDLELKIKEIRAREKQERAKLAQLKSEQEALMTQLGTLSGLDRKNAIYRGRQLLTEIHEYENGSNSVLAKLQKEIEEVKKLQEEIKINTPQGVKEELSSKIEKSFLYTSDYSKVSINESTKLLASVSTDREKSQQMADLLTSYSECINAKNNNWVWMWLPRQLPDILREKLYKCSFCYQKSGANDKKKVHYPDKLIEVINEIESSFEKAKANYTSQWTFEKLINIFDAESRIKCDCIDVSFFQKHADKLGSGKLEHLQSIVDERRKLEGKVFKTKKTKSDIEDLKEQIKAEQSKIYEEIKGWYQSQNNDILGIKHNINFNFKENLDWNLKYAIGEINESQQAIIEMKEMAKKVKQEIEQKKQNYETEITEVAQQIRTLAGPEFEKTEIPYFSDSKDGNMKRILDATISIQKSEIIDKVQREAQNQADTKEAELRGITVEQLYEEKRKALEEKSRQQSTLENEKEERTR